MFSERPPDALCPLYSDAGAILETKPFKPFGRESAEALRSLLRRYEPDIVHLHFVNLHSFDVAVAGIDRSCKVIFSAHASDIPKERTTLRWFALRAANRTFSALVDQIIAPSNYVNARLVREGVPAKNVITLYNGVNLERFRNAPVANDIRTIHRLGANSVIVLAISQLIPEKGLDYLIDAAAITLKQGADVAFIHIGDGPGALEYLAKVRRLGIEERFIFAGLLNLTEISPILRQSDIFIQACTWGEAFSLTILEALAAGKPAIVTRMGGNVEAIEDGRNGILVAPRDAPAIANAIKALHDNPERRQSMGRESAIRSSYFSVQRWVDETIGLYRRLI